MARNRRGVGTKATGYAGPEFGPFTCAHCVWFERPQACEHPEVMADPQLSKDANGYAIVKPDGCCNRYSPLQKIADVKLEDVGL